MNTDLHDMRLRAAESSGGASADYIYNRILNLVGERRLGGEVLDYGAGVGRLTARLFDSGFFTAVSGADLMPRPAGLPQSIAWFQQDLNEPPAIGSASFDVVIAAEVIEHLENPRALARDIFRILRPGGTAIISTPNNESVRSFLSLILRGHYVAFLEGSYPAHITALLRTDLHRLLHEAGFLPPEFAYTNWGGVPKWPTLSWQQISGSLLCGRWFSDNVIAVTRKPQ